jgi:hypothetical protein
MPRYMVERTFPDGLRIPMTGEGAVACLGVVGRNADLGVTWIHSYVSDDKKKTYCVYDGPDPEAIRKAAQRNGPPSTRSTRCRSWIPTSTSRLARDQASSAPEHRGLTPGHQPLGPSIRLV